MSQFLEMGRCILNYFDLFKHDLQKVGFIILRSNSFVYLSYLALVN